MPIYRKEGDKLFPVKEESFKLEADIQKLTEQNLNELFNLELVASQYKLKDFRFDTLAFDAKTKSFVIIEYKKGENLSVIDQGFSYLKMLLDRGADLVLEYNERFGKSLKKDAVDWGQSRVIFVSPHFSKYQTEAVGFKDLPMELWEVHRYENGTVLYNQLESPEVEASISSITGTSETIKQVEKQVKAYSEEDHLTGVPAVDELYQRLKSRILELGDDVTIKPTKLYVSFKRFYNLADVVLLKSKITIYFSIPVNMKIKDPENRARDVAGTGHWGKWELSTGHITASRA